MLGAAKAASVTRKHLKRGQAEAIGLGKARGRLQGHCKGRGLAGLSGHLSREVEAMKKKKKPSRLRNGRGEEATFDFWKLHKKQTAGKESACFRPSTVAFPTPLCSGVSKACFSPLEFSPGSFNLLVGVRDSGDLEASTALQVTIVNINDEIPRFTR